MSRKYREVYVSLIDSLERHLFPFQESEEEQESFTPEGRRRVDQWLRERILTPIERDHVLQLLRDAESDGSYYGPKKQYWARHARIIGKMTA